MAAHKVAHATLKGPSVVKEILMGFTIALAAGSLWKMHHWNEQRKVRAFYDMLEKGEISVVAEEEGLNTATASEYENYVKLYFFGTLIVLININGSLLSLNFWVELPFPVSIWNLRMELEGTIFHAI
ncbi:hypothetical protein SAY87_028440 [Trapa incisa]|uniref:Cytochrome c oxidase subunit 5C n=1 Tax=Trapa incisa TaxID=236973 RepID=A0AAN7L233_9MYRT|nr:hypothetical protein SAY87_028440 [Trapa incisa]